MNRHMGYSEDDRDVALQWFVLRKTARRMAWAAATVAALAGAALGFAAGKAMGDTRMSLQPGEPPCFARVLVVNKNGPYNADETLVTLRGPVVIRYDTVGGHNATDDDMVTVTSLPDGVMADPMHMALPDGHIGVICLYEWLGG